MSVYVYVIGSAEGPYKVGIAENVARRLGALRIASPVRLEVHAMRRFPDRVSARQAELGFHVALGHARLAGEWFGCRLEEIIGVVGNEVEYVASKPAERLQAVTEKHGNLYEWLLGNMRGFSEAARQNLATWYGLSTINPEDLAKFRAMQIMSGHT